MSYFRRNVQLYKGHLLRAWLISDNQLQAHGGGPCVLTEETWVAHLERKSMNV